MQDSSLGRDRQALRRQLRERRRELAPDLRHAAARRAATLAEELPAWDTARSIAGYLAMPEEFDCGPLLDAARRRGKQACLPCVTAADGLQFRRHDADDPLREGRFGICQPLDIAEPVDIAALDILFLPLVGWKPDGTRLGMGAGYYDRTLAAARPGLLVGLGYDCQECSALTAEHWDVPLDYVLTESRLLVCNPA